MKILVVSGCSASQKHDPYNKLLCMDFSSSDRLAQRTEELSQYKELAVDMYTGDEHQYVALGLEKTRASYGKAFMDLSIISTGYGLLNECCVIVPYDVPPCKSPVLLEKEKSDKLHNDIENLIRKGNYDLIFFLLGQKYYQSLQLHRHPFQVLDSTVLVFLIGRSYWRLIPRLEGYHPVSLNFDEFGGNRIAKGQVFKKLCKAACRESEKFGVFKKVIDNPQLVPDIARSA